jgi:hypothetical protein
MCNFYAEMRETKAKRARDISLGGEIGMFFQTSKKPVIIHWT